MANGNLNFYYRKKMKKQYLKLNKLTHKLKISLKALLIVASDEYKKVFMANKMTLVQAAAAIVITFFAFAFFVANIQRSEYARLLANIPNAKTVRELRKEILENKIKEVVKGTPMEKMSSYISEKDEKTAAFLVGIAKKESNFGKRKPVLEGKDCFNYWGYRGIRERMGSGGHTCFDSPKDAVDTVSRRVTQIIERNDAESAKNMIVWKCGSSCESHSPESVSKWIRDVDFYVGKILN